MRAFTYMEIIRLIAFRMHTHFNSMELQVIDDSEKTKLIFFFFFLYFVGFVYFFNMIISLVVT